MSRLPCAAAAAAAWLALGCGTTPEATDRCAERGTGASLEVECEEAPGSTWSQEAQEEAEESMEERRPGGRR